MSDLLELPPILAEFAEVAGVTAALQIAHARGGTEVYFPKPDNLTAAHWLVETVGIEAARKLAERFGGGHCEIPLGPHGGNRGKVWQAINRGLSEGKSNTAVARMTGVHYRTVRRHRNGHSGRPGMDDSQIEMFPPKERSEK